MSGFSGPARTPFDLAPATQLAMSSLASSVVWHGDTDVVRSYSPPNPDRESFNANNVAHHRRPGDRGATLRAAHAGRSHEPGEGQRQAARRMDGTVRSGSPGRTGARADRGQLRDHGLGLSLHERSGGDLLQLEGHGQRRVSRRGDVLPAQERD